jgi:hypothetical protein
MIGLGTQLFNEYQSWVQVGLVGLGWLGWVWFYPNVYWIVACAPLVIPDEVVLCYRREAKPITLNVKAVGIVAPMDQPNLSDWCSKSECA